MAQGRKSRSDVNKLNNFYVSPYHVFIPISQTSER